MIVSKDSFRTTMFLELTTNSFSAAARVPAARDYQESMITDGGLIRCNSSVK